MWDALKLYTRCVGAAATCEAIWARATGTSRLLGTRPPGVKTKVYLRAPSADVWTYHQVFVLAEYAFEARDPAVIVDAGANIGLASVLFANRYPNARILAIEPERANFELLVRNVAAYPNVAPVHAALWHERTTLRMHDPGLGAWGFMTSELGDGDEVRTVTVEQLLEEFRLDRISILKIDIEGAEKEVFAHSAGWIDKVDSVIVELHDRKKTGCSRSFYNGSNGFDAEWYRGENVYLSRKGMLRELTHTAKPGPLGEIVESPRHA